MKSLPLIPLGLCLAAASCLGTPSGALAAQAAPDNAKIAQVKAGALTQANASWWGFDADDATDCLQNAINSGVSRLVVDNTGSDWIINKPIHLVSNQQIIFADGVVVQAKKDCFHGNNDSLFVGSGLTNILMQGEGKAVLRMRKKDYQDATKYTKAEWRMGISLRDCSNFTLRDLTIADTGGDGLYVGAGSNGACKNILVENVVFDSNHRQGVSVISVDGLTIRNSKFINTDGTPPQAGIDFEPNAPGQRLVNCVLENCVFANNTGGGVDVYAVNLNGSSPPISITVNRSVIYGNRMGLSATATRSSTDPVRGNIVFNDCEFDRNALHLRNAITGSVQYIFRNCTLNFNKERGNKSPQRHPVLLTTDSRIEKPIVGNIIFDHTTIINDGDEAPIGVDFNKGSFRYQTVLSDDISGTLYVKKQGRTTLFDFPAFIRQTREELENSDPSNIIKRAYAEVEIQDITKQWRFLPDAAQDKDVTSPSFDDSTWKTINGGNWWQREGFPKYHGLAWYRKTLDLPALTGRQKALLFFDGVDGTCQVFVNGKKVGEHVVAKDYTGWNEAFRFDVTSALQPGKNVIAVRVASKSLDTASGINQPVHLVIGTPK